MSNIIVSALEYRYSLPTVSDIILTNDISDLMPIAKVENVEMKYNFLAYYDKSTKVFTWAWYLNTDPNLYTKTKKLIQYGINKTTTTLADSYIRRLLLTPQFTNIEEHVYTLLISIGLYLTKAEKYIVVIDGDMLYHIGLYS